MPDTSTQLSPPKGTLMQGKRGLIMGVANNRSIAWAIAQAVAAQGGECAFTYQGEALEKRVRPLAASINSELVLPCDVTSDAAMDEAFAVLKEKWGKIDFLVHAIGFADKNFLRGR
jgi:enoyl-[acyl-carrier protein] reductase I